LVDCDNRNFGCTGGWVREALAYSMADGVMRREEYGTGLFEAQ